MQSTLVLVAKIGLLLLMWLFIFLVLRTLTRETPQVAGVRSTAHASALPVTPSTSKRGKSAQSITVENGPLAGSHISLAGHQDLTIGRSPDSSLVIEDDYASGSHTHIFLQGSQWFIEDLDSRNGTYVDGQKIDQPEHLEPGQQIRIGQTELRIS